MEYIHRDLADRLSSFLDGENDHIVLLSGARQTGKSTLAEHFSCRRKKLILNLWDEEREIIALRSARTFSEFEHVLDTVFRFSPSEKTVLIIDEAQASEYISSFIMEMHRKWRGQKVILLGSLLANLYKKGQPLPVGRTVEFVCRPLNFSEFLRFRKKEHLLGLVDTKRSFSREIHLLLLDEYRIFLQIGGLPGIVSATMERRDLPLLFESLLNNIYRDADRFIDPLSTGRRSRIPQYGRILESVMKAVAHHTGAPTQNTTLLSSDSPAYRMVLPHVLEALGAWHLAYTLTYQTAQLTSKKGYSSKKYLFDTGVTNFLINRLLPVHLGDGSQHGAMLLENAVLQDCVSCVDSSNAIQCYRSSNRVATELDFVVTCKGRQVPLEVKSSPRVKNNTVSQLLDFMERSSLDDGYVIYSGMPEKREVQGRMIHFLPPYMVVDLVRKSPIHI